VAYALSGVEMSFPLYVFETSTGAAQEIAERGARAIVFSPDGNRLAYVTGGGDGGSVLRVWDARTGASVDVPGAYNPLGPMQVWFSASGRYLIYYEGVTSPPESLASLVAFDIDSASNQSLDQAIYVSPSADGRYVAFEGADGKVAVWSETTTSVVRFEAASGPLQLSADGQTVLFHDSQQNLRLVVLGRAASVLVASSVPCPNEGTSLGPEGTFSEDSTAVGLVAPVAPCDQPTQAEAVHLFGIASGEDKSLALPANTTGGQSGFVLDVASSAVAYLLGAYTVHVWSPAFGDVSVGQDLSSDGLIRYAALAESGSRGLFALEGSDPRTAWLWDRDAGTQSLAALVSDLNHPFEAQLDRRSGVAVAYDAMQRAFIVSRPGEVPSLWVSGVNAPVASASDNTFVVSGTSGTDTGLFALSLASGSAAFLEPGEVVAAGDTQVFFVAADGLCVIATP
jgi:hypothetical protein